MTARQLKLSQEDKARRKRQRALTGSPLHRGRPKSYRIDDDCALKIEMNRRGRSSTESVIEIIRAYALPDSIPVESFE